MKNDNQISRKKFLLWSTALLTSIGLIKLWKPMSKKESGTAKFLTKDGQLVEVDTKHLDSKGVKIYTSDLKDWVKK